MLWECDDELRILTDRNGLTLYRVPAHSRITVNKKLLSVISRIINSTQWLRTSTGDTKMIGTEPDQAMSKLETPGIL